MIELAQASAQHCAAWADNVKRMRARLGWPDAAVCADRHESGAVLAFSAPGDQLLTATEVNEWAWLSALGAEALLPVPLSPGHPALADEASAVATLHRLAAAEQQPMHRAIGEAALQHALPVFEDDDGISVGAGSGSHFWRTGQPLPLAGAVPWGALHDIPTVLVTGSNGKTTTVRLLAAICDEAGLAAGFNCTDGVFIAGEQVQRGDYSGPAGARQVLRDSRAQVAVLETARGGILRRGLAVQRADAAIITNLSRDHFGEYGMHDLNRLADAKFVVARALAADATLVLSADDPLLAQKSAQVAARLAWFALDQAVLQARIDQGEAACAVANGRLRLWHRRDTGKDHTAVIDDLGAVVAMPLTLQGAAHYNIANIAGAALLAHVIGIPSPIIAATLVRFGANRGDNPGRLERWEIRGCIILLDYAHNPDGLAGLLAVAKMLRGSGGRLGLLLGQAGNRDDNALAELAAVAASAEPSMVVLKDLDGYMRGRSAGEVPRVLECLLLQSGIAAERLRTVLTEVEAAQSLVEWAQPGDVVVLPVHNLDARQRVVRWLDQLGAGQE